MRREAVFGRNGYYRFLLRANLLLHRDAADEAFRVVRAFLRNRPSTASVGILDLACGGLPITIAEVMDRCSPQAFHYTGVDFNPEQVERARSQFRFPANVTKTDIVEGNAWSPRDLGLTGDLDIVFSGMNLHHGTPEELHFLGLQLHGLLARGGILISHDVYRPDRQPYQRRPDTNPEDASESFRIVPEDRLSDMDIPPIHAKPWDATGDPEWRQDYIARMHGTLIARGAEPSGATAVVGHVRQPDFPVSSGEFSSIFDRLGFGTRVIRYDGSDEPLAPYIAMTVASQRPLDWL
jgi:SAM-dependent methyltransferase